jgi:hypothetical protein
MNSVTALMPSHTTKGKESLRPPNRLQPPLMAPGRVLLLVVVVVVLVLVRVRLPVLVVLD